MSQFNFLGRIEFNIHSFAKYFAFMENSYEIKSNKLSGLNVFKMLNQLRICAGLSITFIRIQSSIFFRRRKNITAIENNIGGKKHKLLYITLAMIFGKCFFSPAAIFFTFKATQQHPCRL